MDKDIEIITAHDQILCYIIKNTIQLNNTMFITPPDAKQQVGFIVYPKGGHIARHVHKQSERNILGMAEVLVIRSGRCQIDIYDDNYEIIATRELCQGDIVLMVRGGHGFKVLEDTIMLEIKQGPYLGVDDKILF